MFESVGKKIKGLAVVVFVLECFVSFVVSILVFLQDENVEGMDLFWAFLAIVGGCFVAWLSVLLLYAFGELVDSNQTQVTQNKNILGLLRKLSPDSDKTEPEQLLLENIIDKTEEQEKAIHPMILPQDKE